METYEASGEHWRMMLGRTLGEVDALACELLECINDIYGPDKAGAVERRAQDMTTAMCDELGELDAGSFAATLAIVGINLCMNALNIKDFAEFREWLS